MTDRQPVAWTTQVREKTLLTYDPDCAEIWRAMGAIVEPVFMGSGDVSVNASSTPETEIIPPLKGEIEN